MGEMYALKEFPKAVFGLWLEVGTIRCGNWKVPDEISVGHAAGAFVGVVVAVEVVEADVVDTWSTWVEVAVGVEVAEVVEERPRPAHPKPPACSSIA